MKSTLRKTGFIALCGLGVFWSLPLAAQQNGWGEKNKLEDAEIIVEKNRVNELPEANRNFEKYKIAPPEIKPRQVSYRFADYRLASLNLDLPMRVLTIKQEELPLLMGNYVKLGFGNYGTPYLKGYFHSTRNNKAAYGADVSHISSSKGPVPNSGVSNSAINLNAESYGDVTYGAKLGYAHDKYNFYGFTPVNESISEDSLKHSFNRISAEVFAHNHLAKAPLQYKLGLGFNYFNDNFSAKESNLKLGLGLGYTIDENSAFKTDADFSLVSYKDLGKQTRTFFRLRPTYERRTDALSLTLGVTLGLTNDTLSTARKFNIYPAVHVAYEVVDDKIQLFGGIGGDLQRTTLFQLSQENPWLNQNVQVADVNKALDIYGGLTGNLGKNVKFTGKAAYQSFRNLYFFNNSVTELNSVGVPDSAKFDIVYDNGTTKVINVYGELDYNASDRFRLGLKANYNKYTTDELEKPFYRPAMQATLSGTYNFQNKIFINTDLFYISNTYGQITKPSDVIGLYDRFLVETDNIVDLNLKVDYRFSDKFSTFVMANNILGKNYQRFYPYPSKGLQVIGGITYLF